MWLFVLIIITHQNIGSSFDLETKVQVIATVKKIFRAECVFLLHSPGFRNNHIVGQTRRLLATYNVAASVMTFDMLNTVPQGEHCRYVHPLSVMVFNDEATLHSLRASPTSDGTRSRWLLFLDSTYVVEQFLTDVYIPFNCEFLVAQKEDNYVTLSEVYRVSRTLPLQIHHFGNWTYHSSFSSFKTGFYNRRNDLQGLTIRAGYFHSGSLKIQKRNDSSISEVGGFFGEVWVTLQDLINFKTEYLESEDKSFGSRQQNGTWSGLMGMISEKKIDLAVNSLVVSGERNEVVDFTMPLLRARLSMFIRKPEGDIFKWNNFLSPFSTEIWVCVISAMMVLTVVLTITSYLRWRLTRDENVIHFNLFLSFDYVYTSFCQQGCSVTPISTSCRIVCLVTKFTATVILAGYSAYLIAHLAVHQPQLPFTDFESLLEDGTYKLGVLANSFTSMLFTDSNVTLSKKIYEKLVAPTPLPATDVEGLYRLCSYRKYTYLTLYELSLNVIKTAKCQITDVWKSRTRNELAFPIEKGSPYRGIINHYLNFMRQTGILRRLRSKWYPPRGEEMKKPWDSVPIDAVASIMLIPVLGIVVAMLVLAGECLIHRLSFYINKENKNEDKLKYFHQTIDIKRAILKREK